MTKDSEFERRRMEEFKKNSSIRATVQAASDFQEAMKTIYRRICKYGKDNQVVLLWSPELLERAVRELINEKEENFGVLIPEGFEF